MILLSTTRLRFCLATFLLALILQSDAGNYEANKTTQDVPTNEIDLSYTLENDKKSIDTTKPQEWPELMQNEFNSNFEEDSAPNIDKGEESLNRDDELIIVPQNISDSIFQEITGTNAGNNSSNAKTDHATLNLANDINAGKVPKKRDHRHFGMHHEGKDIAIFDNSETEKHHEGRSRIREESARLMEYLEKHRRTEHRIKDRGVESKTPVLDMNEIIDEHIIKPKTTKWAIDQSDGSISENSRDDISDIKNEINIPNRESQMKISHGNPENLINNRDIREKHEHKRWSKDDIWFYRRHERANNNKNMAMDIKDQKAPRDDQDKHGVNNQDITNGSQDNIGPYESSMHWKSHRKSPSMKDSKIEASLYGNDTHRESNEKITTRRLTDTMESIKDVLETNIKILDDEKFAGKNPNSESRYYGLEKEEPINEQEDRDMASPFVRTMSTTKQAINDELRDNHLELSSNAFDITQDNISGERSKYKRDKNLGNSDIKPRQKNKSVQYGGPLLVSGVVDIGDGILFQAVSSQDIMSVPYDLVQFPLSGMFSLRYGTTAVGSIQVSTINGLVMSQNRRNGIKMINNARLNIDSWHDMRIDGAAGKGGLCLLTGIDKLVFGYRDKIRGDNISGLDRVHEEINVGDWVSMNAYSNGVTGINKSANYIRQPVGGSFFVSMADGESYKMDIDPIQSFVWLKTADGDPRLPLVDVINISIVPGDIRGWNGEHITVQEKYQKIHPRIVDNTVRRNSFNATIGA